MLNTGTGLKHPGLVAVDPPVLAPGQPVPEQATEPSLRAE